MTELTPDHLEAFFVSLYERGMRPTTILARHHALSRCFAWLVAENELTASPLASIRAPAARLGRLMVATGMCYALALIRGLPWPSGPLPGGPTIQCPVGSLSRMAWRVAVLD